MSSDSDDRVSDHGRQIVESIEPIEDLNTEYTDISDGGHREKVRTGVSSHRGRVTKREPVSDDGSEESDDSRSDSDSPEEATKSQDRRGPQATGTKDEEAPSEDENELSRRQIQPSYQIPLGVDSDFSHVSDSTDSTISIRSQNQQTPSLKDGTINREKSRKRKTSTHGPESQVVEEGVHLRSAKKNKKSLNRAYLDVLNQDIEHVSSQGRLTDPEITDGRAALPSSQIGLTFWTAMEKELFFEALGRLGRDNTAGIAERIHTKGEMEVRQYMKLLQDALIQRRQQNELDPLGLEDFPSAMELSHECCQALEEVADSIAMRQERTEVDAEEHEFGADWLVSGENHKRLELEAENETSKSVNLFRMKEWLSLSERFFMNAPTAEGNWQSVDGNAPSIRLTTLDEFHSLALTLTRRLVAASHYMGLTRIRAENGYRRQVREFVKVKDVHAAALSLGFATQKPPLTKCVRRLGLSVYEDPPKPGKDSELNPISATDVEEAFSIIGSRKVSYMRHQMERIALSDESSISSDSTGESDAESNKERDGRSASDDDDSQEEEDIKDEANEAILYSAVDPPQTKRDRQALYRRIKAEREHEKHAEAVDIQQGYQEEMKMWKLLGQQPPQDVIDPGPPPSGPGRRVNLSVDTGYSVGRDWRAKTSATSEWEAHYMSVN